MRGPETTVKDSELVSLMRTRRSKRMGVLYACNDKAHTSNEREKRVRTNTKEKVVLRARAHLPCNDKAHTSNEWLAVARQRCTLAVSETATEKRLRERAGKRETERRGNGAKAKERITDRADCYILPPFRPTRSSEVRVTCFSCRQCEDGILSWKCV